LPVELYRVDDRLIHGQVVIGWAQPLGATFIMLVDDAVAESEWEQDLYRVGVSPDIEVMFESVEGGCRRLSTLQSDKRCGIVLTSDVRTMRRLHECSASFNEVNLGGIHTGPGRSPCLRYVYLSDDEEEHLMALAARGVTVTAQDLPVSSPTSLKVVLQRRRSS
jgi:PTS system mannose-specific IIB component/fructoselysine and glucoselysine-specific PTS system IIB component